MKIEELQEELEEIGGERIEFFDPEDNDDETVVAFGRLITDQSEELLDSHEIHFEFKEGNVANLSVSCGGDEICESEDCSSSGIEDIHDESWDEVTAALQAVIQNLH